MLKDKRNRREKQEKAEEVENQFVKYLKPVLSRLKEKIDRRLVKTFQGLVMGIREPRPRNHGLLSAVTLLFLFMRFGMLHVYIIKFRQFSSHKIYHIFT